MTAEPLTNPLTDPVDSAGQQLENHAALIQAAAAVVQARSSKNGLCGDVGAALISAAGELFCGVCVSVGSNTFCAEFNAIGSMITAGEYRIARIVAVWKDEADQVFVIPPCGNCRQLMLDLHAENLQTQVVLDRDKAVTLAELMPYHNWWQPQD